MATINTTEELLALLRENQEFRDAVRREVLTEGLIGLPSKFDSMVQTQNSMLETQNRILNNLAELRQTQNSMLETQNSMLGRLDNIEVRVERMSDDFGNFRGNYAETEAVKNAASIVLDLNEAKGLGLDETNMSVLTRDGVRALARGYGLEKLDAIDRGRKESLYKADLVIEVARKADSSACYIAVEASYTCDERDTRRAVSNADLLTKFTGKEAWPVIAGVRKDGRIQALVNSGEVFWRPLSEATWARMPPIRTQTPVVRQPWYGGEALAATHFT